MICGIASFGDDVCLLTYSIGNEDDSSTDDDDSDDSNDDENDNNNNNNNNNDSGDNMNTPRRPELRILDRETVRRDRVICCQCLAMRCVPCLITV